MKIELNDKEYDVVITRKSGNKNIYMRVKDDLKIYVTANRLTPSKYILMVLQKNEKALIKMIDNVNRKNANNSKFFYLGKEYDVIYTNNNDITLGEDKVFIDKNIDIKKWYKKKAQIVFKAELDKIYRSFPYDIPYPSLTIREMKTRWGVCNTKDKKVTLNLSLIKMDLKYLDYVIVHELCHLIYANHSKDFWNLVMEIMPDCKQIRKELRYEK